MLAHRSVASARSSFVHGTPGIPNGGQATTVVGSWKFEATPASIGRVLQGPVLAPGGEGVFAYVRDATPVATFNNSPELVVWDGAAVRLVDRTLATHTNFFLRANPLALYYTSTRGGERVVLEPAR